MEYIFNKVTYFGLDVYIRVFLLLAVLPTYEWHRPHKQEEEHSSHHAPYNGSRTEEKRGDKSYRSK